MQEKNQYGVVVAASGKVVLPSLVGDLVVVVVGKGKPVVVPVEMLLLEGRMG